MNLKSPVARRIRNLLFIGIFLYVTCIPHGGFLAFMLLPFFVCAWLFDLFVTMRRPERRARSTERVLTWVLAFCIAGTVNLYWYRESRGYANKVVGAVMNYRARTGTYPPDLQDVGISQAIAVHKWMLVYGVSGKGEPLLIYPAPWDGFDTYAYDFDTGKWVYWAD